MNQRLSKKERKYQNGVKRQKKDKEEEPALTMKRIYILGSDGIALKASRIRACIVGAA